jgi:hypothetical protein
VIAARASVGELGLGSKCRITSRDVVGQCRRCGRGVTVTCPNVVSVPTSAFGKDVHGCKAEAAARLFGTPKYIVGQTLVVIAWMR